MARRLDVLVVNDGMETGGAMVELLRMRAEVRVAHGLRRAVDELVRRVPDAIVCDQHLPPYRGDVLLAFVAREHPQVRRVLCLRSAEEELDCLVDAAHITLTAPRADELLTAIVGGR
jgi:response regulator RpfG family c-di-GMP phosphodiesterase